MEAATCGKVLSTQRPEEVALGGTVLWQRSAGIKVVTWRRAQIARGEGINALAILELLATCNLWFLPSLRTGPSLSCYGFPLVEAPLE